VSGVGQLWRTEIASATEESVELQAGVAVSLPLGTAFQFRALGEHPLELVMTTLPPWPGPEEAVRVAGVWPASAQ
jgi:mannose-6-phosphate isomerase-like protein (cupin superfamily)